MKIISWNVNGIRSVAKKGFLAWMKKENADIYCLQETKAFPHQLEANLREPDGYHASWHLGERPGYAGTVTFSKDKPLSVTLEFKGHPYFHDHGRIVETGFKNFTLFNVYFPNGSPRANGQEMLSYKLNFFNEFFKLMEERRKTGQRVIACGDFNVCHHEIDIARPKENAGSIGFLPIERAALDKIVAGGYIDVFRHFYPDRTGAYTWWSFRSAARQRNVGWRLDYFFVSSDLLGCLKNIRHETEITASDHCPVVLELQ